jgi:hypothetical protein
MELTFNNPLEVNENDTLGTAFVKNATKGYLKGVLAAGLGLSVLAYGVKRASKKKEPEKKEEDINEELESNWGKIKDKSEKDKELVDAM